MNKPLVTLILPVYNVERYLDKCFETIVAQTYKNIEIVVINDGSSDSSLDICCKWAKKDKRIKIITKKNAGLGEARNTGLDNANGSYVAFIDSDDFVSTEYIEKMIAVVIDKKVDTVFCGHNIYYSDNKIEQKLIRYDGKTFSSKDIKEKILVEMMGALPNDPDDIILPVSVWHGIYSMNIINAEKIRFPSERKLISEDMIFDIDYLSRAQKIAFISNCLYYYRKNNNFSLTTVYNPQRFDKEIILYKALDNKLKGILTQDKYILRLQRTFLGRTRSCIVRVVRQKKHNKRNEIKRICNNEFVQKVLSEYPYYQCKLQLRAFNFCIKHKLIILLYLMVKFRY